MTTKNKLLYITVFVIICLCVIVALIFSNRNLKIKMYNFIFPASQEHFLSCKELPSTNEVKQKFTENLANALKIAEINGNEIVQDGIKINVKNTNRDGYSFFGPYVSISVNEYNNKNDSFNEWYDICPDKADIRIILNGRNKFEQVKTILGKDFYGIPYRIINV